MKHIKQYLSVVTIVIALVMIDSCGPGRESPPPPPPKSLASTYIRNAFYTAAFNVRHHVQLLAGVTDDQQPGNVTLTQALTDVKNKDNRRLLIPYKVQNRFVLIGIVQHTGKMIYLDPKGDALPVAIKTELEGFCNSYLKSRFKIPAASCIVDDYTASIGAQIAENDDSTATMRNIRDLIDSSHKPDFDFALTSITSLASTVSMSDKQNILKIARDQHRKDFEQIDSFKLLGNTFPATYETTGLEYAAYPYKPKNNHLGTYTSYARDPAKVGPGNEEQGSLDDTRPLNIITSIDVPAVTDANYVTYHQNLPLQDYFETMHGVDRYWATRPPNSPMGHYKAGYPEVGCPTSNPNYLNKNICLQRVSGYVFRGDGRDITTLLNALILTPPSRYIGELDDAYNVALSGGLSTQWNKTWVQSRLYSKYATSVANHTLPDYNPLITTTFTAAFQLADVKALMKLFNSDNTVPGGQWGRRSANQSLMKSFYEYTILNPYIHTVIPRAKGMLSTTKSLIVAKGFTANVKKLGNCGAFSIPNDDYQFTSTAGSTSDKFRNCMSTNAAWSNNKYVYALFIAGGFDIPQPDSDPWEATGPKRHPFKIFSEQELPVPGSVPSHQIVGYAAVKQGYLGDTFFLADDLAYDDPTAYLSLYRSFNEGK